MIAAPPVCRGKRVKGGRTRQRRDSEGWRGSRSIAKARSSEERNVGVAARGEKEGKAASGKGGVQPPPRLALAIEREA